MGLFISVIERQAMERNWFLLSPDWEAFYNISLILGSSLVKYWFYLSYFLKAWAVFGGGRVGRSIRMMEKFKRMIEHLGYRLVNDG